jgi:transcription elongation factor GreA
VTDEGVDEPEAFVIVGAAEADPSSGRISNESPIGKALMERKVGDRVVVQVPAGEILFEIQAID